MNNQIDRENIKFLTIIELEDIIFEQYQKINTGTNLRIILTQFIILVLSITLQIIFKNKPTSIPNISVSNIISFASLFMIWILFFLVVINNKINQKHWIESKQNLKKLFNILAPAYKREFDCDTDYQIISEVSEYRKNKY